MRRTPAGPGLPRFLLLPSEVNVNIVCRFGSRLSLCLTPASCQLVQDDGPRLVTVKGHFSVPGQLSYITHNATGLHPVTQTSK